MASRLYQNSTSFRRRRKKSTVDVIISDVDVRIPHVDVRLSDVDVKAQAST